MRNSIPPALPFAALSGALALAACVTVPGDPDDGMPGNESCNPAPAQGLVGERATGETGQQALALTGARILRWGPPDTAWTMEYREGRVNVSYDRAMIITQVTCG